MDDFHYKSPYVSPLESQGRHHEGMMDRINRVPSYRDYMDDIPAGFGVINILPLGNDHDEDDRW